MPWIKSFSHSNADCWNKNRLHSIPGGAVWLLVVRFVCLSHKENLNRFLNWQTFHKWCFHIGKKFYASPSKHMRAEGNFIDFSLSDSKHNVVNETQFSSYFYRVEWKSMDKLIKLQSQRNQLLLFDNKNSFFQTEYRSNICIILQKSLQKVSCFA